MRFLILSALVAVAAAAPQFYPFDYSPYSPFAASALPVGNIKAAETNAKTYFADQAKFYEEQAKYAAELARSAAEAKRLAEEYKPSEAEVPKAVNTENFKIEEPKDNEIKSEEPKDDEAIKTEAEKIAEPTKTGEKPLFPELKSFGSIPPFSANPISPFSAALPYYQPDFPTPYYF